ncbi:hypothetical protein I7I53_12155 [Histoplasma capsulatum var. duboisii H88]|uniref:Uncharacterized protein n=1 Tax=Ajellomyces capsulatus (strain H88) TaxID=544711 RepID=A0A8A1LVA5_AJEC8|nr:hypothetical protein I7I53_12155 [Histoplasma capsulatum var. duboisii H88]
MARVFFEITGNREYIFTSIWIKYNNNAIKAAGYNTCGMGWLVRGEQGRVGIKHHASGSKGDRFLLPKKNRCGPDACPALLL